MQQFIPKRAYFEPQALEYTLGREMRKQLEAMGVPIVMTSSHNRITGLPGRTLQESYGEAKKTLVVGVRRTLEFATCKPSAHYQLPLATSCPSLCEYCYLATTLGRKPYVRVYVNLDEILQKAAKYIENRKPELTLFEGAATSDPLPTEYLTGSLSKTIAFLGEQDLGRFRFVTKHEGVGPLLNIKHQGHTRIRFSINPAEVIQTYEHHTATLEQRLQAARQIADAGYPLGFIIAPVILAGDWELKYDQLLQQVANTIGRDVTNLHFEVISHRFTKRAKNQILNIFPQTKLPMVEEERKFKFGQFGYGKYIYSVDKIEAMKAYFSEQIALAFPQAIVDYVI